MDESCTQAATTWHWILEPSPSPYLEGALWRLQHAHSDVGASKPCKRMAVARPRSRERYKGRSTQPTFLALPHHLMESPQWAALTAHGKALLVDIASQYRGSNNGDLCAALTVLRPRGWKSSATLSKTLKELVAGGWIERTRQGGRHRAALWAITWRGIDECNGKHDVAPNPVPSNRWRAGAGHDSFSGRVVEQTGRVADQSWAKISQFPQKLVA